MNLNNQKSVIGHVSDIEHQFVYNVCSDLSNAFWERKKHIVYLPYKQNFDERQIPTKASDYMKLSRRKY